MMPRLLGCLLLADVQGLILQHGCRDRNQRCDAPVCDALQSERLTVDFQRRWIDSERMSGATVVITCADEVMYRHAFGTHDADTLVCAYSLTKVVTSIACLQLAEQGLLGLDEPVSKYLTSFRRGDKAQITLRHCLSHQAGFDYANGLINPAGSPWASYRWLWAFLTNDLRGYVDGYLARQPLLFSAGTSYNYADGANVAAAVVEAVYGMPFDRYVHDRITSPLGMQDTTFVTSWAQRRRYPQTRWDLDTLSHPVTPLRAPFRVLSRLGMPRLPRAPLPLIDFHLFRQSVRGDGGLKTSASDWCRLVQMLLSHGALDDGSRILTAGSVDEIGRSVLADGATLTAPWALSAAPACADGRFGLSEQDWPAVEKGLYRPSNSFQGQVPGLGVNVVTDPAVAGLDPRAAGTCWWMGIASTYFSYNREADIGCIVLAQEWTCFRRVAALAHVIEAAHEMRASRDA